jgi:pimeloyl-ACP methyl ester carboxylesterase
MKNRTCDQQERLIQISGATLFYRVRGRGPLLLIIAGGHGDADSTNDLRNKLIADYTVVTYDRRGLSRGEIDPASGSASIATHSDDVHRLLAAITTAPALVFGSGIAALTGLELVSRHPEQVATLVAHEPPGWELLPNEERHRSARATEVKLNYRRSIYQKCRLVAREGV